jgi:hypothetical protein
LMILALEFIIPLIVTYWVPKYLPGLAAFKLFLPGFFFLSIILTAGNILQVFYTVRKRLRVLIYLKFAVVMFELLVGILFINLGWKIQGVAFASTISYLFYSTVVIMLASKIIITKMSQKIRFLFEVFGLFVLGVGLYFGIDRLGDLIFGNWYFVKALFQVALCGLIAILTFFWLDYRIKIKADILPMLMNWKNNISQSSKR